ARLDGDGNRGSDCGPRQHPVEPTPEVRERLDVLPLPLPGACPADACHVGDRIAAGEEVAVREPPVHHPVKAIDLVGEAFGRIRRSVGCVEAEVVTLAGLWARGWPSARTAIDRPRRARARHLDRTSRSCARDIAGSPPTRRSRSAGHPVLRDRRSPASGYWARSQETPAQTARLWRYRPG